VEIDEIDPKQTTPSFFSMARNVTSPLSGRGQAVLYATRDYTRPDGAVVTLRSNPLLLSVYEPAG
jgi:hypothetical protein